MEKIQGYVDRILFQSEETGYTVMRVLSQGQDLVCVGNCRDITVGETIEAQGEYVEHPQYGRQLKLSS